MYCKFLASFHLLYLAVAETEMNIFPINWTIAETASSSTAFTVTDTINASPCLCDLTEGCDLDCCCDRQCSTEQQKSFGCQPMTGSVDLADHLQKGFQDCLMPKPFDHFRLQLFCMKSIMTPFLGDIYHVSKIAKNDEDQKKYLDVIKYQPNIVKQLDRQFLATSRVQLYKYGTVVRSAWSKGTATISSFLSLPQPLLDGHCSFSSPILYLKNINVSCPSTVSASTCAYLTILDATNYIAPRVGILERETIWELDIVGGGDTIVRNITVTYWCSHTLSGSAAPWTRCPVKLGEKVAKPQYFEGTGTCDNVVREVVYQMSWSGSNITGLVADIYIDSISVQSKHSQFRQKFSVAFWQNKNETNKIIRSKNGGYERSRYLIAGNLEFNSEEATVNIFTGHQLYQFKPDTSGLCQSAKKSRIKFGENVTVSCFFMVDDFNEKQCSDTRQYATDRFEELVQPTHISLTGHSSSKLLPTDFTQIIKESLQATIEHYSPINGTDNICELIPTTQSVTVFYTEDTEVIQLTGIRIRYNTSSFNFSALPKPKNKILLTTVVTFITTTKESPTRNTKKYYLQERRDHCPSSVTCWDELFYPFVRKWNPTFTRHYAISAGLATVIVLLAVTIIN